MRGLCIATRQYFSLCVCARVRQLDGLPATRCILCDFVAPPRQHALRQQLQRLGSFRSVRLCCISSRPIFSKADQAVLHLADSHLDFFIFLQVALQRLHLPSFSFVPWRDRIDPILPTMLVFHFRLIHLRAVGPTADHATLAFLAAVFLLLEVGPSFSHIQALLWTAHSAASVCSRPPLTQLWLMLILATGTALLREGKGLRRTAIYPSNQRRNEKERQVRRPRSATFRAQGLVFFFFFFFFFFFLFFFTRVLKICFFYLSCCTISCNIFFFLKKTCFWAVSRGGGVHSLETSFFFFLWFFVFDLFLHCFIFWAFCFMFSMFLFSRIFFLACLFICFVFFFFCWVGTTWKPLFFLWFFFFNFVFLKKKNFPVLFFFSCVSFPFFFKKKRSLHSGRSKITRVTVGRDHQCFRVCKVNLVALKVAIKFSATKAKRKFFKFGKKRKT